MESHAYRSTNLSHFQDLFQLAQEQHLLLTVGEGPELEELP